MRGKQKILLGLLVVTFLGSSGMFYYQNVYMKEESKQNRVQVLVAKKDISEGAEFTSDNVGAILMDKDTVLPSYVTSFSDLKGRTASDDLLNSEIITKPRIEENSNGTRMLSVGLVSKNIPPNIKKGDNIRLYVQSKLTNQVYEVFEKKEVVAVNMKKSSSGKETTTVATLDVLMSDEEAVLYYSAQKIGDFYFARYYDLTENNVGDTPKFTLEVAEQLTAAANEKKSTTTTSSSTSSGTKINTGTSSQTNKPATGQTPVAQNPDSQPVSQPTNGAVSTSPSSETTTYEVNKRDTFDSIAEANDISVAELKAMNPGVTTLSAGDIIVIKKG